MDRRDPKRRSVYKDVITKYIGSGKGILNILVCGTMGTGKSSLINTLIGKDVSEECLQPLAVSDEIVGHQLQIPIQGTDTLASVTIWDTPGVGDLFGNDEDNLKKIAKMLEKVDLLLYCMDMRSRLGQSDVDGMRTLTNLAGSQIWKNAVLALTFANKVNASRSKENPVEHFKRLLSNWQSILTQFLEEKLKVPIEITQNISVMPAGYRNFSPPDRDDWLSCFWMESFRKTKRRGQPILLGINIQRITVLIPKPDTEDQQETSQHAQKELHGEEQLNAHEQSINIIVGGKSSTTKQVVTAIGFAAIGAILGLVLGPGGSIVGAAIGGKIGMKVASPSKIKGDTEVEAIKAKEIKPDWAVLTEAIQTYTEEEEPHMATTESPESPQTEFGKPQSQHESPQTEP